MIRYRLRTRVITFIGVCLRDAARRVDQDREDTVSLEP